MFLGGLVVSRFLSLLAHFVVTVIIFLSKDANVKACLPLQYTESEFSTKDMELIVGLSLTLVFLGVEFGGFIGGCSMFNGSASMLYTMMQIPRLIAGEFVTPRGLVQSATSRCWPFTLYLQGTIAAHSSAAISLSMFVIEEWDCDKFWYVFGFCSAFPVVIEIFVLLGVIVFRADR